MSMGVVVCCAMALNAGSQWQQGLVKIPGKGRVAFVNAADADGAALELAARKVGNQLMIETAVQKGSWSIASAQDDYVKAQATVAVFVVRDASLPTSLIALERKWGVVNVEGLPEKALTKEAVRVAAFLLGCGYSKYPASVLRPVFTQGAIADGTGEIITIDALMAIQPSLATLGIAPYRVINYEDALEQGIAPPPANDMQRKIKEEFEKNRNK